MNCQEFWDRMPELTHETSGHEFEHLRECAECARAMSRQRLLTAGLRGLRQSWQAEEAPARVEAGLVAAFRAQARASRKTAPAQTWIPVLSWAAAAVLLAALALTLVSGRQPGPPRRTTPGAVELAVQSPDADGFIPLPNTDQVDPGESLNVVRVELPRSAMLAVGLPVTADQASELVEADVKLGPNGLARAVRFLNE